MGEKFTKRQKRTAKGPTDWKKVEAMTERQIIAAAKSDPDAQPLKNSELKHFKCVHPVKEVNVKDIRNKLHISQEQFAKYFGVSVRTVQEWEQHRKTPTATARNFLRVIEVAPGIVQKALSRF
jgi:putative transcriptional regulator